LKVEKVDGATWGKFILRRAYMGLLPESILWRRKTPLELGSGFTGLRGILETKLSDWELEDAGRRYGIRFRSKEHLYYYEIYRSEVGEIPGPKGDEKACLACGGGVPVRSKHCRICGAFPV
jgi:asparagine synthase (glutamine-hydrolysing)